MRFEVRRARPEEYEEAGRVTAAAYREHVPPDDDWEWGAYLRRIADVGGRASRAAIIVAVEDGRVLGSATLELDQRIEDDDPPLRPGEGHIRMLGVDPSQRRRGVARALVEQCMREALADGKDFLTLHTTQRMRAAQSMYEALGFRRLPDRVFPDGFRLLTYRLSLEPATGKAAR
jgi:ribosomal protein S18 acetylase RimI-like enzyme